MPHTSFGFVLVVSLLVSLSPGLTAPPETVERFVTQNRASAAERLNIASFYFDRELDELYSQELERLGKLCAGREAHRKPLRLRPVCGSPLPFWMMGQQIGGPKINPTKLILIRD